MKLTTVVALAMLLLACSKSEQENNVPKQTDKEKFVRNMRASPMKKMFFKFKTGTEVELPEADNWDIGFYGAQLLLNGGTMNGPARDGKARGAMLAITYSQLKELPDFNLLKQDVGREDYAFGYQNGGKSWYYMTDAMVYTPYNNKCGFLQTADGKGFVKFEILSYYRDMPSLKGQTYESLEERQGYYTFRYQYIEKGEKFN